MVAILDAFNVMKIICVLHNLPIYDMDGAHDRCRLDRSRTLILGSKFMELPKIVCHIPQFTSISQTGKLIATDSDKYTLNDIESKMFRYKLNTSRITANTLYISIHHKF